MNGAMTAEENFGTQRIAYMNITDFIQEMEGEAAAAEGQTLSLQEQVKEQEALLEELGEETTVSEEKLEAMQEDIDRAEELLDREEELQADIEALEEDYDAQKADQEEALAEDLAELEQELEAKSDELEKLLADIETKEEELEAIGSSITAKQAEPVSYPAGTAIVGIDMEPGRYLAEPIGSGSNFAVYSGSGSLEYNLILSTRPDHGVEEVSIFLFDDYMIDARTPYTLTPIDE
ncbi:hypothetical protein HCN83_16770 [Bacillus luteus]|uniref:Uncharacterized protein n=2 Tax=Alkalicoccus luteus TaxID=1237094 RepID=A0A969PTI6_9BACI|nr:hypothetical protein [Alkalicoccus luteus]